MHALFIQLESNAGKCYCKIPTGVGPVLCQEFHRTRSPNGQDSGDSIFTQQQYSPIFSYSWFQNGLERVAKYSFTLIRIKMKQWARKYNFCQSLTGCLFRLSTDLPNLSRTPKKRSPQSPKIVHFDRRSSECLKREHFFKMKVKIMNFLLKLSENKPCNTDKKSLKSKTSFLIFEFGRHPLKSLEFFRFSLLLQRAENMCEVNKS